jgi:hypothetical protein
MTCTVMFGNGVRIIGVKPIKVRRRMEVLGKQKKKMLSGCCAAALGTPIPTTAAPLIAFATRPTIGTTTSVFGLLVSSPGLFFTLLLFCLCGSIGSSLLRAPRDRFKITFFRFQIIIFDSLFLFLRINCKRYYESGSITLHLVPSSS